MLEKFGVEKVKTIGSNYMVVSGMLDTNKQHALACLELGMEMQNVLLALNQQLNLPDGMTDACLHMLIVRHHIGRQNRHQHRANCCGCHWVCMMSTYVVIIV